MRQVWLLARRDLLQRARTRSFMVTLGLSVLVVLALGPLSSLWLGQTSAIRVGVTGPDPAVMVGAVQSVAESSAITVQVDVYGDAAAGEAAVRSGRAAVLIETDAAGGQTRLVWKDMVDARGEPLLTAAVQQVARSRAATELGLAPAEVARLVAPEPPASRSLVPTDPNLVPRVVGAQIVVVLLYVVIAMFGQFVLMGVMEEKASRVVEVVLSRARPAEVLAGKVIGIGLLGLLEVVAIGAAGLVTVRTMDVPGVSLPSLGLVVVVSMVAWFILGYTFYAVLYAAMGATISRQEDVQGAAVLPTMLLLPGYFIGLFAGTGPETTLTRVASLVPMWSPIVMPARIAMGLAAWWEVALAVGLLVASSLALVWLGGRIYAGAILRVGRKVRLRDAWRAGSTPQAPTSASPSSATPETAPPGPAASRPAESRHLERTRR